jgi:class 3 adenylate cyclase
VEPCPACGADLPGAVRFCPSCGAQVAEPTTSLERKVVTVLFADVSGSTGLAERLDPERFKEVMDAFFEVVRREIEAQGGTIEKFIGDAVMAVFGAPAAHEDDPARALLAALGIREGVARLNEWLLSTHGLTLAIRMGVNTGKVVAAGSLSPRRGIVSGDPVNVAARLEQAAAPDQILVAERTARAARGFGFEEVGPVALKGKEVPILALALAGRSPGTSRTQPAPLVGRDQELSLLESVYRRVAAEGRPHLVTVFGDPGVGKSRLIHELRIRTGIATSAPAWVRGRCLPYGEGVTYWPLADILRRQAGVLHTDSSGVATMKVEETALKLLGPAFTADPERATTALLFTVGLGHRSGELADREPRAVWAEIAAAWRSFFSALAGANPTAVVVEDLHWADQAMLELLEDLTDHARGPLLFLCTARPELSARGSGWGGGRRNGTNLLLEPLSLAESARLLSHIPGSDRLPPEIRELVLERSGGNPFFLEELARFFAEDRAAGRRTAGGRGNELAPGMGREAVGPDAPQETGSVAVLPDTVQGVLTARIDLTGPRDKETLQLAAVVGRTFWSGIVARLLGRPEQEVEDALARLEDHGLVFSRLGTSVAGEREYAFKHILTSDAAYESLPRRRRALAHAEVAAWIEERLSGREREFAELLAHHCCESFRFQDAEVGRGQLESLRAKAFHYSLLAAEEALRRLAPAPAQEHARAAASLAGGPLERSRALAVSGRCAFLDSRGDDAWLDFRAAVDLLVEAAPEDGAVIARLCAEALEVPARAPGTMRSRLSRKELEPYLSMGLAKAGMGDSEELARLLAVKAILPAAFREQDVTADERADAEQAGERAADIAIRLDRPALASSALDAVAFMHSTSGRWGMAESVLRRRLQLTDSLEDPWERGEAHASAAHAALNIGRYKEALRHADEGFRAAGDSAPMLALHCIDWRAWARFCLGDWEGVLEDVDLARQLLGDRRDTPPALAGTHAAVGAYVYEATGHKEEADQLLNVVAWLQEAEEWPLPAWAAFVASLLVRRGALMEARDVLDALPAVSRVYGLGLVLEAQCAIIEAGEEWAESAALVSLCRRQADEAGLVALPLHADRLEGEAALARGRTTRAVRALVRAVEGFTELGARWDAARTALVLAKAEAGAGDRKAARRRLALALPMLERIGAQAETETGRTLAASLA